MNESECFTASVGANCVDEQSNEQPDYNIYLLVVFTTPTCTCTCHLPQPHASLHPHPDVNESMTTAGATNMSICITCIGALQWSMAASSQIVEYPRKKATAQEWEYRYFRQRPNTVELCHSSTDATHERLKMPKHFINKGVTARLPHLSHFVFVPTQAWYRINNIWIVIQSVYTKSSHFKLTHQTGYLGHLCSVNCTNQIICDLCNSHCYEKNHIYAMYEEK